MKTQRFTLLFLMLLGAFITHVALAQKAVAPPTQNGPGDTQYKIASSQNGVLSTSYVVSGAGSTEVNGTYVQSGTYKYEYYNSSNGMTYVMGFSDMYMRWHIGDESFWEWDPYYTNNSSSDTPPSTGWLDYMGMPPSPTVSEAGRTLSFNTSVFIEHENNDGSISNSIIITYNEYGGDALTGVPGDDFVMGNKVTVTNVPTGLTPQIIKKASNQLTFSLVGNAQDHSSEHSVSTIRVEFQNSAFVGGDAANIIGYLKSDIKLYYDFFSGGNGSVEEPYLISNKYDLRLLSENITGSLWEKHFKQTADITFELSDFQEGGIFFNDGEGWIPIGNNSKQFVGRYNGGYKTISGLFINRPDTDYQGFFGVIGGGCRVENLGLINVSITGKDRLGGFVGTSFSSSTRSFIGNCYVIGTVSRSENSNVFYYGGAGGFIGSASYLNIENCYASATVTGNQSVGGFVGIIERQSTIQNCYALGDVFSNGRYVGGFVGYPWYSESVIENCYARGNVTRTSGSATEFGGFCGENYNSKIQKSYSTGSVIYGEVVQTNKGFCGKIVTPVVMSGNFWDTQTSGATTTSTNDNATGKTTAQMKTQSTFTDAGWDFTESTGIWSVNSAYNDGYPFHQNRRTYAFTGKYWTKTAGNWSESASWWEAVPPTNANVVIAHDIVLNQNASISTLTTNAGATFTTSDAAQRSLTVVDVINNGVLNIVSGGTVLTSGTVTGSGTTNVEQALSSGRQWWYLSSPLTGATSNVIRPTASDNLIGDYTEATTSYSSPFAANSATPLTPGKGYVVKFSNMNERTVTFTGGLLTSGDVEATVTRTGTSAYMRGFNLVGNPYPSYIDWDLVYANASGMRNAVWVRTHNGSIMTFYTYSDGDGVPEGLASNRIAPMQGFWVKVHADNTSPTLTFKNSHRGHFTEGDNPLRIKTADLRPRLRLVVSNGQTHDETLIVGKTYASNLLDSYDIEKMSADNPSMPEIYSLVQHQEMVINSMNTLSAGNFVNLGFRTGQAGAFTMSITQLENIDAKVVLVDRLNGSEIALDNGYSYSFTSDATTTNDRFSVEFRAPDITTNEKVLKAENLTVWVDANNWILVQSGAIENLDMIRVYTITGQEVVAQAAKGATTQINHHFVPGVYMVIVKNVIRKVVIN